MLFLGQRSWTEHKRGKYAEASWAYVKASMLLLSEISVTLRRHLGIS